MGFILAGKNIKAWLITCSLRILILFCRMLGIRFHRKNISCRIYLGPIRYHLWYLQGVMGRLLRMARLLQVQLDRRVQQLPMVPLRRVGQMVDPWCNQEVHLCDSVGSGDHIAGRWEQRERGEQQRQAWTSLDNEWEKGEDSCFKGCFRTIAEKERKWNIKRTFSYSLNN